jgi:AcrR family transcriptional regulator
MYIRQSNPAAIRSQAMISEALIALMRDASYADITVTDICRRADVVRKTFYRNFGGKDDVVHLILDGAFSGFIAAADIDNARLRDIFGGAYGYIADNREFLIMFYRNDLLHFAAKKLEKFIVAQNLLNKIDPSAVKPQYLKYLPAQISAVLVGIMETWIEHNFSDPPADIAALTEDILSGRLFKRKIDTRGEVRN